VSMNEDGCGNLHSTQFERVINGEGKEANTETWVRESNIGRKFLRSSTWFIRVLTVAVCDLSYMLKGIDYRSNILLDAGSGPGVAFPLLRQFFSPRKIIAVDIDADQIRLGQAEYANENEDIQFIHSPIVSAPIEPGSVDMIFCHQLLHHTEYQEEALDKFYQILNSGGILLVGESCRKFINIWWVRLFFRHPNSVQKSTEEYIELIKNAGFKIEKVQKTSPWWSRFDMGEKLGVQKAENLEPTELLVVARKPV